MGNIYDNVASEYHPFGLDLSPMSTAVTPMNLPRSGTFKFVDNIENVRPSELPMDGSWGVYILQDFSKVYMSRWTVSGVESKEFIFSEIKINSDIEKLVNDIIDKRLKFPDGKNQKKVSK